MIASKFDEIDYNLVKVSTLERHLPSIQRSDFVKTEKRLLVHFNWDVNYSTPLHFLQIFETCGVAMAGEDAAALSSELRKVFNLSIFD
jgi:hypothetical protein